MRRRKLNVSFCALFLSNFCQLRAACVLQARHAVWWVRMEVWVGAFFSGAARGQPRKQCVRFCAAWAFHCITG